MFVRAGRFRFSIQNISVILTEGKHPRAKRLVVERGTRSPLSGFAGGCFPSVSMTVRLLAMHYDRTGHPATKRLPGANAPG